MDYFYIGDKTCMFQSKKPCWIIRQFQKLIDLHWVSVPESKCPTKEEIDKWDEDRKKREAERIEKQLEAAKNREEDMQNFCEKMGVNVGEYPSLLHAYCEALKIKRLK